jgi:precorrin-6B methylase 2
MNEFVKKASKVPTLTSIEERELLSKLAQEVKPGGLIVEIGALYGGVTAVLALSAPEAQVITIDNFSWHPDGFPETSPKLLLENMAIVDVHNVKVIHATSQEASLNWNKHVDLLWIDGGHDFKTVYFDLYTYGQFANVIALHDYGNPAWSGVQRAINIFLSRDKGWYFDKSVELVAVLRRK